MFRTLLIAFCLASLVNAAEPLRLTRAEFLDRIEAVWTAQMIAVQIGWAFEHKPAASKWIDKYDQPLPPAVPIDDDWYYEMILLKALEDKGVSLTVEQLGEYWDKYNVGTWGSSEQARLNVRKGIKAPRSGHPIHNRLWFTMGNQCRGDLPGLLAIGQPNVAAKLSRYYGHINSYAEGTEGGVLLSAMIAMAPFETDPREIVRKAIRVLPPERPHRQVAEMMIAMSDQGKGPKEIAQAIEDKWHSEYPATNNAVANGGLAMLGVWFGEGDFLKTMNVVFQAADYTDADCNAAFAAAVVAAMKGKKAIPEHLWRPFNDRIRGDSMGHLKFPMVDESISNLSRRTMAVAEKMMAANGAKWTAEGFTVPAYSIEQQAVESFTLQNFVDHWAPGWTIERASYGAPGGGLRNLRGGTFVDGDVLSTFPKDEVRGLYMWRKLRVGTGARLQLEVASDAARSWQLQIFADNKRLVNQTVDGAVNPLPEADDKRSFSQPQLEYVRSTEVRKWYPVDIDLKEFAGQEIVLRLYQTTLLKDRMPGNAYWRGLRVTGGVVYVNSYHEGYGSSDAVMAGIRDVLGSVEVIFLDAKRNPEGVAEKAQRALTAIRAAKPELLIVSDDDAVKHLVVPHFRNGPIPVVFCGVNWDASGYGLPTPSVTGMLEVVPVEEALRAVQAQHPGAKRLTVLSEDSVSERSNTRLLDAKYRALGLTPTYALVNTFADWKAAFVKAQSDADVIYMPTNGAIRGWVDDEAIAWVRQHSRKPSVTCDDFMLPYVALGLTKVAREQGEWAANTALAILGGKKPGEIAVTRNSKTECRINPGLAKQTGLIRTANAETPGRCDCLRSPSLGCR